MDEGLPGTAPAHLGNFAQEMAWAGAVGAHPPGNGGGWSMDGLGACGRALILPAAGAQKPRRLSQGHSAVRMGPVVVVGGSRHHTRAHPSSVRTLKAQASHCPGFG